MACSGTALALNMYITFKFTKLSSYTEFEQYLGVAKIAHYIRVFHRFFLTTVADKSPIALNYKKNKVISSERDSWAEQRF
jgi:hypothetical protein